jgi:ribosome-associated translation inhibitor RaiA
VDIVIHSHHAVVSEHMRKRAVRQVVRAAARFPRIVEAIIRFEEDGPTRRVTITLRAPRHHDVMGRAEGRYFGPSITAAIAKVLAQTGKEKRGATGNGARRAAARSRV